MSLYSQRQIHILIGCADARDLNQVQIDSVNDTIRDFRNRKIDVEMHVIRAAGSFITPDVVMDIKRIIDNSQKSIQDDCLVLNFFIHIQTHAHLTDDSQKNYISQVFEFDIVEGSPLNCGMTKAGNVAIEIEKLILEEKPTINIKGEMVVVDTEAEIKLLLSEVYAYDGYLAGDWIKGISFLRTHARTQRTVLERAIESDVDLKTLGIKITAGIQDYSIHSLIRVDDGDPKVEFWDTVQLLVRQRIKEEKNLEALATQADKQEPMAGLLCMPDPRISSRSLAARYYQSLKGFEDTGVYLPNTVFNMSGSSFDMPLTPFGPYVITGFYFSVKYLGLTDQMVMGYDSMQTNRIMQKIMNDPLMNLFVKKFNVNLIPINQVELLKMFKGEKV